MAEKERRRWSKKRELFSIRDLGKISCMLGTLMAWIGWLASAIPTMLMGICLNILGVAFILYAYTTKEEVRGKP